MYWEKCIASISVFVVDNIRIRYLIDGLTIRYQAKYTKLVYGLDLEGFHLGLVRLETMVDDKAKWENINSKHQAKFYQFVVAGE